MNRKKQIKFYVKFKNEINEFCENNNFDINELFTHPLSCNEEFLMFYYNTEDTKEFPIFHGEKKLKPLLSIYLRNNKLEFILDENIGD